MEKNSIRNIVVALDFDGEAPDLLQLSAELGSKLGAAVHLVHVYQPDPARVYDSSIYPSIYPVMIDAEETAAEHEEFLQYEKRRLRRDLAELLHADVKAKAYMKPEKRSTAKSILEFAGEVDADLLLIGTNCSGALEEMIVGSVAKTVLKRSTVPVLLIPPHVRRTKK